VKALCGDDLYEATTHLEGCRGLVYKLTHPFLTKEGQRGD